MASCTCAAAWYFYKHSYKNQALIAALGPDGGGDGSIAHLGTWRESIIFDASESISLLKGLVGMNIGSRNGLVSEKNTLQSTIRPHLKSSPVRFWSCLNGGERNSDGTLDPIKSILNPNSVLSRRYRSRCSIPKIDFYPLSLLLYYQYLILKSRHNDMMP